MPTAQASQRERLLEAVTAVSARYGYREASIARIVAQAKVSRATFYEHFADKEDCFLAAYREVAAGIMQAVRRFETEGDGGLREVLACMLANADADPAAARVVLVESLAAGATVRAEHERLLDSIERSIDAYLEARAAEGTLWLEIPARSLLGGVGSVIAIRVFQGEAGRLTDLLDDLEVWLCSYAIPHRSRRNRDSWEGLGRDIRPPASPEPSPLDQRLPRGRAALPPAAVAGEQRQRVLAAVARVASEKGYDAMTVADIVAVSGIGREAFYEHFRGKEGAFLAAQSHALETSLAMAASKFFGEEPWRERVWNAAMPMLEYIASVPDLAALDFIESYTAGTAAIRRSFESRMAYTLFLEEGYRQRPEAERLPRLCSEAVAGAILELLRRRTVEGGAAKVCDLAPHAVYVALAPFIGPVAALELVEGKVATPTTRRRTGRSHG